MFPQTELVEDSQVVRTDNKTSANILKDIIPLLKKDEVNPSVVKGVRRNYANGSATDDDDSERSKV
ncbi:hypothetical protein Neosp_014727 [[Neocosmospora] mangrovei]